MTGERQSRGVLPSTEREKPASSRPAKPLPAGLPAPGQVIAGKYQVERVIGAGGMGVVLSAHHMQLAQRVAIKFMRAEAVVDESAVGRFLREARAAVALSNEHVTRVLDVGTLDTGEPYMVMEYLDGVDLARVLQENGPMPLAEVVGSVLQACEAIAEAHFLGIVHRDLKPANLFLSKRRDGSTIVKVLDFGISKVADFNTTTSANLTASGLVMGSPGYMSPEQVRNAKGVDTRSDIWALGVILYELVTGVRPFAGETVGEILAVILSDSPPSVRRHRPELPEGLAGTIARCLERRIDRRIQDVGELASKLVSYGPREAEVSLERILRWRDASSPAPSGGGTLTAAPASVHPAETGQPWLRSSGYKPPSSRNNRWRVVALATVAAVVIVGAAAYTVADRGTSREAAAPSVSPPAMTTGATTEQRLADIPTASTAPPGTATPETVLAGPANDGATTVPRAAAAAGIPPAAKRLPKASPTHGPPAPSTRSTNDEKDLY